MNRRKFAAGASVLAVSAIHAPLTAIRALAGDGPGWRAVMHAMVGEVEPIKGRVKFETPFVARYGDSFRLEVSVESPMTATDYVRVVHVLATGSPEPRIASFHFTSRSGRAMASTRIRLNKSQELIGLAQMSDGAWYVGRRAVKIGARAYPP